MEQKNAKKIKKIGDFYAIKVNAEKKTISGIYFDKKYEKLVKLRDRQAYLWFCIFAILEGFLRPYIFEVVITLLALIVVANLLFYFFFIRSEKRVELQLNNNDFYDVVSKKHRIWQKCLTMTLIFVCLTRLIIFVQPGVISDDKITGIYVISLVLSFFTILFWIYYGKLKNMNPNKVVRKRKKNSKKNHNGSMKPAKQ